MTSERQYASDDQIKEMIREGMSRRDINAYYILGNDRHQRLYNAVQNEKSLGSLGLNEQSSKALADSNLSVVGVSAYVDDKGNVKSQWIKTNKELENQSRFLDAALERIKEEVKPLPTPTPPPTIIEKDYLSAYVLSDYHIGMFANKDMSGRDWSLDIAKDKLKAWIDQAIMMTPPAEVGLFMQMGDMLHFDSKQPVTPSSGHILEADSPYYKVVDIAITGSLYVIDRLLEKHNKVHVIMAEGNHDLASSVWLRAMIARLYENEPRVTIDMTPHPYYCYEWGDTSIFVHHGHKKNLSNVSKTFAAFYREVFGRTKFSYGHLGHYHHAKRKPYGDDGLMDVEIHATLPPNDGYAMDGGYASMSSAKTVWYHKKYGRRGEAYVTPLMLEDS